MYNLKLKIYNNGTMQVSTYSNCVLTGSDKKNIKKEKERIKEKEKEKESQLELKILDYIEKEEILEKELTEDNLRRSISRTKKTILDYARNNVWEWFFTLTISPDQCDRTDYILCSKIVRQWLNNIKKRYCPNLKYLMVPEEHKKGGWHFHLLVSGAEGLTFEKAFSPTGKPLKSNGKRVYNIKQYTKGFATATRVGDTKKASSYITKYITKDLVNITFGKQRYFVSKSLELPEERLFLIKYWEAEKIIKEIAESNGMSVTYCKRLEIENDSYENIITYYEFE